MADEVKSKRRPYVCFIESVCPICGKVFFPTPEWVYNDGKGSKVCSYHCSLEAERRSKASSSHKSYRGAPVEPDRDQKIVKLAKEGIPLTEIAYKFNLTKGRIQQIIRANRE